MLRCRIAAVVLLHFAFERTDEEEKKHDVMIHTQITFVSEPNAFCPFQSLTKFVQFSSVQRSSVGLFEMYSKTRERERMKKNCTQRFLGSFA